MLCRIFILPLALMLGWQNQAGATVVINEIMNNPAAVSDTVGEWFEVVNTGGNSVDLFQWTITDEASNTHVINEHMVLAPGQFQVLARNIDVNSNGGVSAGYEYGSSISLGNGADALVLLNENGVEQDRVMWDGGPLFPDPTGASMYLIDYALDNSIGSYWAVASTAYGLGDLGTPGLANTATPAVVPEPASWGLLGLGLLVLLGMQCQRQSLPVA
jgi:hypothetical protein